MIDDFRLLPKMSTAMQVAILVQPIPLEQAADLIQQYANTQSAGARGEAKQEARQEFYERALRIQNAPLGKDK